LIVVHVFMEYCFSIVIGIPKMMQTAVVHVMTVE